MRSLNIILKGKQRNSKWSQFRFILPFQNDVGLTHDQTFLGLGALKWWFEMRLKSAVNELLLHNKSKYAQCVNIKASLPLSEGIGSFTCDYYVVSHMKCRTEEVETAVTHSNIKPTTSPATFSYKVHWHNLILPVVKPFFSKTVFFQLQHQVVWPCRDEYLIIS